MVNMGLLKPRYNDSLKLTPNATLKNFCNGIDSLMRSFIRFMNFKGKTPRALLLSIHKTLTPIIGR
jgi:hypothetical protein